MPQPLKLALFAVLLALPLVEIAILIKVGGWLGFWPVLLIVILTAVLGSAVVRQRGISVFSRVFAEIDEGRSGLEPMFDSLLAVTAGIFLILPGLATDCLGLLLLMPPVRKLVARVVLPHIASSSMDDTQIFEERFKRRTAGGSPATEAPSGPIVIEGDYERLDERTVDPRRPRPGQR
jgi:UPF0716 protein FxsA